MKIRLIKETERGREYQTKDFKIIYRYKNTISGDNSINPKEIVYLVAGSAEITIKNKKWKIEAPEKIEIPNKTYHKIKALTDICFILFKK